MHDISSAVGVIKGRFQTPEPHDGHTFTIREVRKRHSDVLVILGSTYQPTTHDPLPFELRKMMLQSLFPDIMIIEDQSNAKSYERRSHELTALIGSVFPGREAVIYGARDSIVHTYNGPFPVVEIETVYDGSATEIRTKVPYRNTVHFREGYIRAINDHKAVFYPAVDVAIASPNIGQALMIELDEEDGQLRFPGVFFDPKLDDTYEGAAARCITKEVGSIITASLLPVGSRKIDDWRYRKTNDGVVSMMIRCVYSSGTPTPGHGIKAVHWVKFESVLSVVAPAHRPLAELMAHRWFG